MCQILGMNCANPTDFRFSLTGFCQRGGLTDIHKHGFGLVFYEGRGLRCFHDTLPACQSPIAQLVQNYPMRSYNMMAHIRYATQGGVSLENVHPFTREWRGVPVSFCHNGECPKFNHVTAADPPPPLGKATQPHHRIYHPIGDTDSEAVFCALLNALNAEFPQQQQQQQETSSSSSLPSLPELFQFLRNVCHEIIDGFHENTIFNFLLGFGERTLFAYSWPGKRPGSKVWNGLYYLIREPPFSTAKLLDVNNYSIDFATVTTPTDRVAVITTKPLTSEPGWTEFKRGELIMFNSGIPYKDPTHCENAERQGLGLSSKCFSTWNSNNSNIDNNNMCADKKSDDNMDSATAAAAVVEPFQLARLLDKKALEQPCCSSLPPPPPPDKVDGSTLILDEPSSVPRLPTKADMKLTNVIVKKETQPISA